MPGVKVESLRQGIYVFPNFQPHALFCFSSREFNAAGDLPYFLEAIGAGGERYAALEQVHGDRVVTADPRAIPEADGLVTDERELALIIKTADCVPVFLFDPVRPAVGLCHAGWRGARKRIVSKTVERLGRDFGSNPSAVRAAMGPGICRNCYEVGEEFKIHFPEEVEERGGRLFFDLGRALRRELEEAGVPRGRIEESGFCTSCSVDRFFSARKEGNQTGRLISAAVLK